MMKNARLLPGIVHPIWLPPGASLTLLAENGLDTPLFLQHRPMDEGNYFVINDEIGGVWGEEMRMSCPTVDSGEQFMVYFKFNGSFLELWNPVQAVNMHRFDEKACNSVRFLRTFEMDAPLDTLVFSLETLDSTLAHIEAHLLHRRLEQIERNIAASGPQNTVGPAK